jgi:hypothetical protein
MYHTEHSPEREYGTRSYNDHNENDSISFDDFNFVKTD